MSDELDDGGYSKALDRYNQIKAIYARSLTFADLDWHDVESYRYLPERSGVYRIDVVIGPTHNSLYVGQSRNIRGRFSCHMNRRGAFQRIAYETGVPLRISYVPVDPGRLIEVERYHIHALAPFFNKEWRHGLEMDGDPTFSRVDRMIEMIESWKRDFRHAPSERAAGPEHRSETAEPQVGRRA
jgi:hypothetical protein